jgi:4a-hydroxytetrahydrobiopterin dehydratase
MEKLESMHCVPCKGGMPPLKGQALTDLYSHLQQGWSLIEEKRLEKQYAFKNFREALAFVNRVGAIAESEGHHPDIYLSWGKCRLTIWTHKIGGLTQNDFILAAHCDASYS